MIMNLIVTTVFQMPRECVVKLRAWKIVTTFFKLQLLDSISLASVICIIIAEMQIGLTQPRFPGMHLR